MKKILMTLVVILLITGCQEKEKMNISKMNLEYEYGSAMTSEEILSCLENTDKYIEEVVINFPQNEAGKKYVSVGEHDVEIIHGEEKGTIKVSVKDTVSPVFNNVKESYTVEYGKSFSEEIEADDLSDATITVDDSKVNYKKAGEYTATVKAVDVHGNETKKDIAINVKKEEKEIASSNSSSSAGKETSSKPVTNNSSTSKNETGKSETTSSANKKPSSKPTSNKTETSSKDEQKEEIIFTYEDPVIDMSTHVHDGPAVANKYFTEFDDIDEWAINYRIEQCESGNWIGGAYGIAYCKCGMRYIHRFY